MEPGSFQFRELEYRRWHLNTRQYFFTVQLAEPWHS